MGERWLDMNVSNIKNGDKFVLQGRGGVWIKNSVDKDTGMIKAKCLFGVKEEYEKDFDLEPELFCYVLYDYKKAVESAPAVPSGDSCSVRVKIVDDLANVVVKDFRPSREQFIAIANSETLTGVPLGKRKSRNYHVCEFAYDFSEDCYMVMVMEEREVPKNGS